MHRRTIEQLATVSSALEARKFKGKLLEEIAWPRDVEEQFFANKCERLPKVTYTIDRDGLAKQTAALVELEKSIEGDDATAMWLRRHVGSLVENNRLLEAIGTREFSERSCSLYGSARTPFFGSGMTNAALADHLFERLRLHGWDEERDPGREGISAQDLAHLLTERIAARRPAMQIDVVLDERTTAKVVAGMTKVKIRPDATFARWEAEGLWHHEIETHALTAHNGDLQKAASFLKSGGPRTTRTQEGLAIFSELYTRSLSTSRLERLAVRVKLVDMAEQGADFLDLYRYLVQRGSTPRDAYFDAQRICRGGLVTGGAPFTKDACYLAGLLEVFAFLQAVVRGGFRDEIELLVCGRIALDDIAALAQLRASGILEKPKYLPTWLADWDTLLPFFAFTSFASGIDIGPVEAHFAALIRQAENAAP